MSKINFFFIIYFSISFAYAQEKSELVTTNNQTKNFNSQTFDYPENCYGPFTISEIQKIDQAFKIEQKNILLNHPTNVLFIKDILRNRIHIFQEKIKETSDIPLISSISNKKDIKLDHINFEESEFNPFIHNINFYAKSKLMFRIDSTDYIIVINSRFNR